MKTCCKCRIERPVAQFSRDKSRLDGWRPECKVCRKEYYLSKAKIIQAQMAEYRQRPGIPEKIVQWHKNYRARRFFYVTVQSLRSRAQRQTEVATMAEISLLWKEQRGCCVVTGRRLNRENAQLDHIIPVKQGGSHMKENLRWVHRDVNYAKRDLLDEDFFRLCSEVVEYQRFRR